MVRFPPPKIARYVLPPPLRIPNLSETLSECHFPLRVAGPVAPDRVAP